jgi:hypothetical protein
VLLHHRHAAFPQGARAELLDRFPRHLDRALVGAVEAGEDPHQRGLARAVLAEQGVHLARPQLQVDAVEGRGTGAEAAPDPVQRCSPAHCWFIGTVNAPLRISASFCS